MSKFTEGPWQCEWKSVYSDKAEVIIAHVHDNKDCAIISKAPEMLELLIKAEELIPETTTDGHMLCEEIRRLKLEIEGE